ncbi:MAG: UbiA family prenyltransferase [Bacteroidales bacterium]|nr:UbiA family prenyltransferase [Bacteroidales bacterium]
MKTKILAYIKLFRVPNLLIMAVIMYFFKYFLFDAALGYENMEAPLSNLQFALFVLMFVFLAAGGYALNDYYDIGMDEINRPEKTVLRNILPLNTGINSFFILTTIGLAAGFIVAFNINNITLYFIPIFIAALYWFYSTKYKREFLVGNFVVAFMAALNVCLIYLYYIFAFINIGNLPVIMIPYMNKITLIYSSFAFVITFIREIVKDICDEEGDKKFNCSSLPIKLGLKKTKNILIVISLFVAITLVYFGVYSFKLNKSYLFYYIWILLVPFWIFIIINLFKAKEKKEMHDISSFLKIYMLAGIISLQLLHMSNLWT